MANPEIPNDKRSFRCTHCGGAVLVPRNLPPTTGPCPHCSGVITSPPPEPPVQTAPPVGQEPPKPPAIPPRRVPVPPSATPIPPPPKSIPVPTNAVPTPPAAEKTAPLQAKAAPPKPAAPAALRKSGLIPVMLILLLLIAGAGVGVMLVTRETGNNLASAATVKVGPDPAVAEANYLRIGWQKEAYQVLRDCMAATSSRDKLPHILHGDALATRVEDFYGGGVIDDSDTPAEAFSVYQLSVEEHKRGLFMMIYDQPPQFEMKEFFRPLASLEVQYGLDEADLLLNTPAKVENHDMEPMRVHAFFKRTPAGLKLDWEIFAQTKYRTFQNFVDLPETGQTGVFRIFIVEDVPSNGLLEPGTRTYRMADPANTSDTACVNVKVDSECGRTLSAINWRGTKDATPITRTATVELSWTGDPTAPDLEISRFICWEFIGLGGKEPPSTASTK